MSERIKAKVPPPVGEKPKPRRKANEGTKPKKAPAKTTTKKTAEKAAN